MNRDAIVKTLQQRVPGLLAIYAFGSRITGHARLDSDLDLPVLVAGYADDVLINKVAIIETHLDEFLRFGEIFLMTVAMNSGMRVHWPKCSNIRNTVTSYRWSR